MKKGIKQKIKDGSVIKVPLSENRLVFGRLIKGFIAVYDFVILKSDELPIIEVIISKPILLYCCVYNDVIINGIFEIIGIKELSQEEIENIPPSFNQDKVVIDNCKLFFYDGREYKAKPEECIGLERSSVWEAVNLIERIEDHYSGRKNFNVEFQKVILSKLDPRYLPPPQTLRWNFKKQEFYRSDL